MVFAGLMVISAMLIDKPWVMTFSDAEFVMTPLGHYVIFHANDHHGKKFDVVVGVYNLKVQAGPKAMISFRPLNKDIWDHPKVIHAQELVLQTPDAKKIQKCIRELKIRKEPDSVPLILSVQQRRPLGEWRFSFFIS